MMKTKLNKLKKSDLSLSKEERFNKNLKEWLQINVFILLGLLILFSLSFFDEKGSRVYYKTQNAIFIGCTAVLISLLIRRYDFIRMVKNLIQPEENKLILLNDWIIFLTYVCSVVGLLLVDTTFIDNYGIRISGVVAVNLAIAIKGLIASNKIKWTLK